FFFFALFFCLYLGVDKGMEQNYEGKLLSAEQWEWFENVLNTYTSKVDLMLIVSSIQVLTSNPYFESYVPFLSYTSPLFFFLNKQYSILGWGQYPSEKHKLLTLLTKYLENNGAKSSPITLLLSGDVHHSEMIGGDRAKYGPLEVTTSGLTHGINRQGITKYFARSIIQRYFSHRLDPQSVSTNLAFGIIDVFNQSLVDVSVHDAYSGAKLFHSHVKRHAAAENKSYATALLSEQLNDKDKFYLQCHLALYGFEIVVILAPFLAFALFCYFFVQHKQKTNPNVATNGLVQCCFLALILFILSLKFLSKDLVKEQLPTVKQKL
ncbi:hypothetical protein RFI_14114, partial [Reticulomyxa filosa]